MPLTELQKFIFYNFVRNHIQERKPLGSKLLAKKLKKLSPPTLRFHFQKLVKKGYLRNAEDFSGREPTEKGWHYYLEAYNLQPELKVSFKNSFEEILENVAFLTGNIVFYRQIGSSKFVFKGFKKALGFFYDKNVLFDVGEIIENLEKIVEKFESDVVLIGKEIKESKTGCLSLIIKKTKNFEICFLGHKINFYHTLLSIFENTNGRE